MLRLETERHAAMKGVWQTAVDPELAPVGARGRRGARDQQVVADTREPGPRRASFLNTNPVVVELRELSR